MPREPSATPRPPAKPAMDKEERPRKMGDKNAATPVKAGALSAVIGEGRLPGEASAIAVTGNIVEVTPLPPEPRKPSPFGVPARAVAGAVPGHTRGGHAATRNAPVRRRVRADARATLVLGSAVGPATGATCVMFIVRVGVPPSPLAGHATHADNARPDGQLPRVELGCGRVAPRGTGGRPRSFTAMCEPTS